MEYHVAGARSGGMANANVTLQDAWSVFNNPAGIAKLENSGLGVFYENRFMLKEAGYGAFSFNTPFGGGNLGLGIYNFGFSAFQTNKIGIAYAQQLFQSVSMGVQIDYISILQSEYYGNIHGLTFDIGIIAEPIENFYLGFHAYNPLNFGYLVDIDERIPVTYKFGVSYLFSKSLLAAIETGTAINGDIPIIKFGLEYKAGDALFLRTGISGKPIEYNFGIGYVFNQMSFDIAYSYHQYLGSSPKISVNYVF